MGAWGPGILDNDSALDLKAVWKENLGEGFSPEEITEVLVDEAKENGTLDGDEEEVDFWLSLALIQWKTGRLQQLVLEKAKELLRSDHLITIEQRRWEGEKLYSKRISHLKNLEETLNSSQPTAKKIPKPFYRETILKKGDLITFQLKSGKYFLIEIVDVHKSHQEEFVRGVIYDYYSTVKPDMGVINKTPLLPVRKVFNASERWPDKDGNIVTTYRDIIDYEVALWATSRRFDEPRDKIEIIGNIGDKPYQQKSFVFLEWRHIDEKLDKWMKGDIVIINLERKSS